MTRGNGEHYLSSSHELPNILGYGWGNVFQALKSFCNKIYFKRHGTFRDEKVVVLLFSCTVSVFPLGRVLGSLTVGLLADGGVR